MIPVPPARQERTAWRLVDGVPGHEAQSRALLEALGRLVPLRSFDLPFASRLGALASLFAGRLRAGDALPPPDLLVGAGHAAHAALLAARRARGGRAVVLMRPTLFPLSLFDLCIVPAHDRVAPRANVLETTGVLCAACPSAARDPSRGVVLLGGPPSRRPLRRRAPWNEELVARQVVAVVAAVAVAAVAVTVTVSRGAVTRWTLVPSRRTPASLVARLATLLPQAALLPWRAGAPSPVPDLLSSAATAWVTDESVSMVSEALSAGAGVGLLATGRSGGRVSRGMSDLIARGLVTTFEAWEGGAPLRAADPPLDEAARCARWIAGTWWGA